MRSSFAHLSWSTHDYKARISICGLFYEEFLDLPDWMYHPIHTSIRQERIDIFLNYVRNAFEQLMLKHKITNYYVRDDNLVLNPKYFTRVNFTGTLYTPDFELWTLFGD